jgi:hypothetical protein
MMPDYASLAQAVRRWAQQSGLKVDSLTLSHRGRPVVVLPLPLGAVSDAEAPGEEKGKGLSRVVLDILVVHREAGRPLTGLGILEKMAKKNLEWSKPAWRATWLRWWRTASWRTRRTHGPAAIAFPRTKRRSDTPLLNHGPVWWHTPGSGGTG